MFRFLKTSLNQIAPSRLNSKPTFSSSLSKMEYLHFVAVHMSAYGITKGSDLHQLGG